MVELVSEKKVVMAADHWMKLQLPFNLVEVIEESPSRSAKVGGRSGAMEGSGFGKGGALVVLMTKARG